jgi:hypothetical protein
MASFFHTGNHTIMTLYILERPSSWGTTGSKYLEYNPGSELNIFQWTMNIESWIEQNNRFNKSWTKDEQRRMNKLNNNNNNNTRDNWQTSIMHNIKEITSVFIELGWNVTIQYLHRVKNILVITELTITTLFARVLIVRHQRGLFAYPAE